jgi:branched-chain amino acid transport system permease protein
VLLYATLSQSWNLTLGYAGLWNFAQLGLFAIGGYGAAILTSKLGVPPWPALLGGGFAAALASLMVAFPLMKLRGLYACLLSLIFVEFVRATLVATSPTSIAGGPYGVSGLRGLFSGFDPQSRLRLYYWTALGLCVLTAAVIWLVMRSPMGHGFVALRDSTRYAVGLGVSKRASVIAASTISACFAGFAGALFAYFYSFINPDVMGLSNLALFLFMVVIGGMGTLFGPITGTVVVMGLWYLLRNTEQWRFVLLGSIMLAILMFRPSGLASLPASIAAFVRVIWAKRGPREQDEDGPMVGHLDASDQA